MIAADLLRWGIEATLATSVAVSFVLLLRRPLRRTASAQIAYFAWALVPLSLLAVSLPGPLRTTLLSHAVVDMPRRLMAAVTVGAARPLGDPAAMQAIDPASPFPWLLAWALGTAVVALVFAAQQRRFVASLGGTAVDDAYPGMLRAARGEGCPAVLGAWRPRIVLPPDFELRWPDAQARLVLAHERAHIARGDTRANLIVALLRCVFWFNPLLHAAARRFRHDQELACDAAVLARHPNARRAYADAMLKTQLAVPGLPVGCHWQSSQSLKERILMLKSPLPGAWHRRAGVLAVAVVLASGSYAAWALQGPVPGTRLQFVGHMSQEGRNAYAVFERSLFENAEISGVEMTSALDGASTAAVLDAFAPLIVSVRDDGGRTAWTLSMWSEGSAASPGVRWELDGDGITRRTGRQRITGADTRLDVALPATVDGRTRTVSLGPLPLELPSILPLRDLARDGDGAWRDQRGVVQGDFGGVGEAVLVAELGADGRTRGVQIESMSQPGLLTAEAARDLMSGNVYRIPGETNAVAGTRVRQAFAVAPIMPPAQAHVLAVASAATVGKAASNDRVSTPAPAYPAKALADRVSGYVLLHLRVATDGSVKDARVAMSKPEGIFDQAALEAARKWKLQPEVRDGKPVEGWMQVPITFSPDGESKASGAASNG